MTIRTPRSARPFRGFTLVEAMVSIVVAAMILVAALATLAAATRARRTAVTSGRGPELARQLLTEVLALAFADPETPDAPPGRDDGEPDDPPSRSPWDDVDDYDGLAETTATYRDGTPVPDAANWVRSVTVRFVDPETLADADPAETGLKRVTVTATAPDGVQTIVSALRSRYGGVEQPPPTDTSYVTWVGVEVVPSAGGETFSSGVSLPNHVVGAP